MMKNPLGSNRFLTVIAASGLLALVSQTTVAAECKGMEKTSCERQDSCTWVDSYERKDGVKVNGYCRGTGGKKSSSSSSSSN
jgi:hypothetical protein